MATCTLGVMALVERRLNRQLVFPILIGFPALVAWFLGIIQGFGQMYPDSHVYIGWAEFFAGANPSYLTIVGTLPFGSSAVIVSLRPVVPLLASLFLPVMGARFGFGFVNAIFWVLGAGASYYIGRKIVSDGFGVICALFYATSVPLLAYGAAVLSDSAGYFFMGLAFCLILQKDSVLLLRRRAFVEGFLMAIGSLANPSGLASLAYVATVRGWVRKNIVPLAAGIGVLLVPVLMFAAIAGWLAKLLSFSYYVLDLRVSGIRSGPPFVDAFIWAFNLSAVDFVLGRWVPFAVKLLFLGAVVAGVYFVPRKKELLLYVPFLLVYEFVAHATIERYLFNVWPVFIPVLLVGLGRLASIFTLAIDKVVRGRIRIDQLLVVTLYIDVQAWLNLISLHPGTLSLLRL